MPKLDCADRWEAYFRLCELDIDCRCRSHQPLEVAMTTPQAMIQTWSVLNRLTLTRVELAQWLDHCWTL